MCVDLRAAIQDQSSLLSSLAALLSRLFLSGIIWFAPTPLPGPACLAWNFIQHPAQKGLHSCSHFLTHVQLETDESKNPTDIDDFGETGLL